MSRQPEVGEFGVTRTGGWGGWLIRVVTRSEVNHAFVYVGNGRIAEAEPAGAQLGHIDEYPNAIWSGPEIMQGKGSAIAQAALSFLAPPRTHAVPYSWLDCLDIGLAHIFGGRRLPMFIRERIQRTDRLMCSALVDYAYHLAGVELWDDGRLFGDVSPGDLLDLIKSGGTATPIHKEK